MRGSKRALYYEWKKRLVFINGHTKNLLTGNGHVNKNRRRRGNWKKKLGMCMVRRGS